MALSMGFQVWDAVTQTVVAGNFMAGFLFSLAFALLSTAQSSSECKNAAPAHSSLPLHSHEISAASLSLPPLTAPTASRLFPAPLPPARNSKNGFCFFLPQSSRSANDDEGWPGCFGGRRRWDSRKRF